MRQTKLAKLEAEVKDLRRWKREAMQVLRELDSQAVGKELNLPLGSNVAARILPAIRELKADCARLETRLSEARRRTIAIDGTNDEVNFLPVSVTQIEHEQDTITLRAASGMSVAMARGPQRVILRVVADTVEPAQFYMGPKTGR